MKKIITIGGATQDIFIHAQADEIQREKKQDRTLLLIEEGSKIEVSQLHYATGGGATNAAASLTLLGHHVTPVCKIALDPAGLFVLNDLQQRGINTDYLITSSALPTGTSFVLPSPSGNRVILAYRGANGTLQESDIPFDLFAKSDGLYVAPLSHDSSKLLPRLVERGRQHNLLVAVNPGKQQLCERTSELKAALPHIDIFIVNEHEAQLLFATLQPDHNFTVEAYCALMLQQGPTIVVVTCGARGVHVGVRENGVTKTIFQKALATKVVNTVGAGDAFGSCFFGMLLHGYRIEKALLCGVMNSASLLTGMDAKDKLLTRAELERTCKN